MKFWVWLKPRGLDSLFESMLPKNIRSYYEFVEANVARRQKEEEVLKRSDAEEGRGRNDLFHYLFNATDELGNPGYNTDELYAEANLLIIAGSDTTATTLVGFWFYITRNLRVYEKLVKEIRTAFDRAEDIQVGTTLSSCNYLQACIDEVLRAAPAGVADLVREVLPGGLEIEGGRLPEGTQLGFGDPWTFRPERWIADSSTGVTPEDVARARSAFNPFTIGAGNCVGQKFAMEELLITVARTLWRMDARLVPGDNLGAGSSKLGWGSRDKNHIVLRDAWISIKDGPMVQFRKRVD
ncbi:putative Cytochrome 67 [Glarea lozoyensis 74030]|uniref:Putative Cytochrome 67 n=1 Tax=Glarea lozoyensis (strain ATCC 74030 / MF5533) TaxID=1104152 RepID=H0EIY2_GLAL7|nr:putative Cytochrome 67 [Glarea lozoyensis 74030]